MKIQRKIPRSGNERKEYIKKLNTMNEFDRLVENLCTSELTIRHVEAAYAESLRRHPYLPEGVWNILTNKLEGYIGTLHHMWKAISKTVTAAELSYRRGIQEGEERC